MAPTNFMTTTRFRLIGKKVLTDTGLLIVLANLLIVFSIGCGRKEKQSAANASQAFAVGSNIQQYKYSELHEVEDFQLTDRYGKLFDKSSLSGKVWIASFFFSNCKFECSAQNNTLRDQVHEKLLGTDCTIVSFTCDPQNDTPEVLADYAKEFVVSDEKWKFLTGDLKKIQEVGANSFKVVVDPSTHTKRLLVVDKWGKFRDSFEWKDDKDLRRLIKTTRILLKESAPPDADEIVYTRALPSDVFENSNQSATTTETEQPAPQNNKTTPQSWKSKDWIDAFELKNSRGETFRSSDMLGKVWVTNFFFSNCTGACPRLLFGIKDLREKIGDRDITFVSISNDPQTDTVEVLKEYSARYRDDEKWQFLTGEEQLYIRRIGSEFFKVNAGSGETHSEKLTVIDKWGKPRGSFSYDDQKQLIQMRLLMDTLLSEKETPK